PTNLTAIGNQTAFAAKYSSTGSLLWAARLGGNGDSFAAGVSAGPGGESYVTGWFTSNLQYGDHCAFARSGTDGFLARLPWGRAVDWVSTTYGDNAEFGQAVAIAPTGDVW